MSDTRTDPGPTRHLTSPTMSHLILTDPYRHLQTMNVGLDCPNRSAFCAASSCFLALAPQVQFQEFKLTAKLNAVNDCNGPSQSSEKTCRAKDLQGQADQSSKFHTSMKVSFRFCQDGLKLNSERDVAVNPPAPRVLRRKSIESVNPLLRLSALSFVALPHVFGACWPQDR